MTVTCDDAAGKPITGANVEVTLEMVEMGSKTIQLHEIVPGQYRGPVEFGMAGS